MKLSACCCVERPIPPRARDFVSNYPLRTSFHLAKALAVSVSSLDDCCPCLRGQQAGHSLAAACCRHPRAGLAPQTCAHTHTDEPQPLSCLDVPVIHKTGRLLMQSTSVSCSKASRPVWHTFAPAYWHVLVRDHSLSCFLPLLNPRVTGGSSAETGGRGRTCRRLRRFSPK